MQGCSGLLFLGLGEFVLDGRLAVDDPSDDLLHLIKRLERDVRDVLAVAVHAQVVGVAEMRAGVGRIRKQANKRSARETSAARVESLPYPGMTLTKSRSAALAADRSETPSPQKKMVGRCARSRYGAVARLLSCPKPDSGCRNCERVGGLWLQLSVSFWLRIGVELVRD